MKRDTKHETELSAFDKDITRRDFVKGTLVGSGAMLLNMPAPILAESVDKAVHSWNGYAGVGDYARSNGNTESVRVAAHLIRDRKVDGLLSKAIDTGESYDLVIVGGGFAGMGAARTFLREAKPGQTCLLLENHALAGGEAKRNEFMVNGHRISGPQGSNLVVLPLEKGDWYDELWNELKIPRNPTFQKLTGYKGDLKIARDNYMPMFGVGDHTVSSGYFFDKETFGVKPYWDINSRKNGYVNTAFPEAVKADLKRLMDGAGLNQGGTEWEKWLDSITYKHYLEDVLQLQPGISKLFDNFLATSGLAGDVTSALHAMKIAQPGFDKGFPGGSLYRPMTEDYDDLGIFSFPGGNDAVFRLFFKAVLPDAIAGGNTFEEIHDGPFQFQNFDRPENPVRIRLNSTAVRIEHDGEAASSSGVTITYQRDGKIYRVKAGGVVSAIGGWVNKHIIKDLPDEHAQAFGSFIHGSVLVVNVALTNWRFLAKLGISSCHYFTDNGLGAFCNIRQPMIFGKNQAPLDPDKPIVLTFYIGFPQPVGLSARDQAAKSRRELLSKSYVDIEQEILKHMTHMFASAGFNAKQDIAGIILNRWGHAYITATTGFYYGKDGQPAPRDVIMKGFSRIAFAHSELNGIQEWFGAAKHGERATRQVLEVL